MISSVILTAGAKAALGFVFDDTRGKWAAVILGVSAFVAWFALENQTIGGIKTAAKIERKDHEAAARIRNADGLSRSGSGGVRDPNAASE